MNKRVIIVILVFYVTSINSQIKKKELVGTWVKVKTEMRDGSRLIPIYHDYIQHFNMTLTKQELITDYYPGQIRNTSSFNYKLKGNELYLSKHFSYFIEKISQDSLIIVEQIDDMKIDKLKRHYLVNKNSINTIKRNEHDLDTEIYADYYYTPVFLGDMQKILNNTLKGYRDNLKLKGTINLLIKDKKVDAIVTYRDKVDPLRETTIINFLDNSYPLWDLSGFEKYDKVSIDFVLIMEKTKTFRGLNIALFTDSFTQLKGLYGLPLEIIRESNKYYKMGIEYYNNNQLELAIENFTKSYEVNHTLIDALYNRAASYYNLGKFKEACQDWKTLNNLEQVEGAKMYRNKCKAN